VLDPLHPDLGLVSLAEGMTRCEGCGQVAGPR